MLKTELQARRLGIRYYRQDVTIALPPSVSVQLNLLYCLFYSTYTVDTEFVHKKKKKTFEEKSAWTINVMKTTLEAAGKQKRLF